MLKFGLMSDELIAALAMKIIRIWEIDTLANMDYVYESVFLILTERLNTFYSKFLSQLISASSDWSNSK